MVDSVKRTFLGVMLCLGVMQISLYYLFGTLAGNGEYGVIAQPDTLLYCQAARRIVDGYPLSFSVGTAVSTGTTSHLYPFILALPYWLGARGETLLQAGFGLNALFYLVFLWGWCIVLCTLVRERFALWTGGGLLVLFGQAVYSACAQSDIGLWMAVSALFLVGLVRRDVRFYGPALIVGPWVRPEGMMCVCAFTVCVGFRSLGKYFTCVRRLPVISRKDWICVVLGLGSVVGVFGFNAALTGECQFSSVARKGYFYLYDSIAAGIFHTAIDFVKICKAFVFGIPQGSPRDFYFMPILGAVCAWLGILTFNWKRNGDWRLFVWPLAVLGGFLSVAMSGMQDTNNNRYFAWLLPSGLVLSALTIEWLRVKFPGHIVSTVISGALVIYAVGGSVAMLSTYVCCVRSCDGLMTFAAECERVMEPGASVEVAGESGVAYLFSPRRVAQIGGVYSPEFNRGVWPEGCLEILKNEPAVRFDYWFGNLKRINDDFRFNLLDVLSTQVLEGPDSRELRRADWTRLDDSGRLPLVPTGMNLLARMDVVYEPDEKAADYEALSRYVGETFHPVATSAKLGKVDIVDCGRLIVGQDEMTIPTLPQKDLRVVMRTYDKCTATRKGDFSSSRRTYAFANPLKLNLCVDGILVGTQSVSLATNAFSDVTFTIPGKFITKERSRIAFCGDHVAYAYWFYQ